MAFSRRTLASSTRNSRTYLSVALIAAAVASALLVFSVPAASAQSEPDSVGSIANFSVATDGQPDGSVRVAWDPAENAQVHFVVYLESADREANNFGGVRMVAVNGNHTVIDGLDGGVAYSFIAIGMRWNFVNFGTVWGGWSPWQTATPAGVAVSPDSPAPDEPQTVGAVTGLTVTPAGQSDGSVRLTWNEAENAQVHFVVYLKSDDRAARNFGGVRMQAVNGNQTVIEGLEGGVSHSFITTGMRWNFVNFGAVWGSWSDWEAATPAGAAAPVADVSLANLEHGPDLERRDPASANRIKALPWVADGVSASEREAAEAVIATARWYQDVFESLMQLPWVLDAVTEDETTAITRIRRSAWYSADVANAMLEQSWAQDNITRDEAIVFRYLYSTIYKQDRSERKSPTNQAVMAKVIDILDMPFLDTVESADALAVRSLEDYEDEGSAEFLRLMEHPALSDGITDEEAKIVVLLGTTNAKHPESVPILLNYLHNGTGVYKEERTLSLPHSGEVLLAVIRLRNRATANMDYFETAVRKVEGYMREPLPTNYVVWFFDESVSEGAGGTHSGTHITSLPKFDDPDDTAYERAPMHIAHEVGHYYWTGGASLRWISEGGADLVSIISENIRVDRPLEAHRTPCPYFTSIRQVELADPERVDPRARCYYSLGQRLWLDLHRTLGGEPFRQAFSSLYRDGLREDSAPHCEEEKQGICHVRHAFRSVASVAAKVFARWYDGTEPYDKSRLDQSDVDPNLTSVNGRVDAAYITLEDGQRPTPVEHFSDAAVNDWINVHIEFSFPRTSDQKIISLEYVEAHEDGFVFRRRTLTHKFRPEWTTGSRTVSIGISPSAGWATGRYWVYVYDGDRKVAEVTYEVVP